MLQRITVLMGFTFPYWLRLVDTSDECCFSQGKDEGQQCPDTRREGEKNVNGKKTAPAGNRMHMALRRMAGWIQEMERKGEEGDLSAHSCVQIEKIPVLKHREKFCCSFPGP